MVWIARGPLPAMTHEIAVELVPSDKLDEMTKAQAAAKPEVPDTAMDQKAEPQSSPSSQRQEQAQPAAPGRPADATHADRAAGTADADPWSGDRARRRRTPG